MKKTDVELIIPANTPKPIGPYHHVAVAGNLITIGGVAGVNPQTGVLAGENAYAQAKQILLSFKNMLKAVGSDLEHVVHINVFLLHMSDFEELNRAYIEVMGKHLPARTVIGVHELPKPGVLMTMNLTAIKRETTKK